MPSCRYDTRTMIKPCDFSYALDAERDHRFEGVRSETEQRQITDSRVSKACAGVVRYHHYDTHNLCLQLHYSYSLSKEGDQQIDEGVENLCKNGEASPLKC